MTKKNNFKKIFFSYKLPNRKKWLLSDAFLTSFKDELDRIFKVYEKQEKPTYWNTYNYLEGSCGFYDALKIASEKHNVKKAIYEYAKNMPWYHSDFFDSELTILMYKRNIFEEGESVDETDYPTKEKLLEWENNGEIEWVEEIKQYNGYKVIKRDWKFVNNT